MRGIGVGVQTFTSLLSQSVTSFGILSASWNTVSYIGPVIAALIVLIPLSIVLDLFRDIF